MQRDMKQNLNRFVIRRTLAFVPALRDAATKIKFFPDYITDSIFSSDAIFPLEPPSDCAYLCLSLNPSVQF